MTMEKERERYFPIKCSLPSPAFRASRSLRVTQGSMNGIASMLGYVREPNTILGFYDSQK